MISLAEPLPHTHVLGVAMSQPQGSIVGTTTIKSVTPDVRAPSRSWSLVFSGIKVPLPS
jgi:hypothetical protein